MIDATLINKELLNKEIESLERGYVETVVNLVKGPVFIEAVSRDLVGAEGERAEALKKVLAQHEANQKANEEAVEQLNAIIPKVKAFLN